MVVAEVLAKDPAQVPLIQYGDVTQTIPPDGTDHASDGRCLPGRARCRDHFLDNQAFDPSLYGFTINAVPVPQQISWGGSKRKRCNDLLGRPLRGGMCGHVETHDFAAVTSEG